MHMYKELDLLFNVVSVYCKVKFRTDSAVQ